MQLMHRNIPYLFPFWANPFVLLLLLQSSMTRSIRFIGGNTVVYVNDTTFYPFRLVNRIKRQQVKICFNLQSCKLRQNKLQSQTSKRCLWLQSSVMIFSCNAMSKNHFSRSNCCPQIQIIICTNLQMASRAYAVWCLYNMNRLGHCCCCS